MTKEVVVAALVTSVLTVVMLVAKEKFIDKK